MIPNSSQNQSFRTFRAYPLSTLCVLAVLVLSLAPIGAPEVAQDVPFFDKWAHFVMYGGLTLVIWWERHRAKRAAAQGKTTEKKRAAVLPQILYGLLFPIFLGGLMELCQAHLTTYRSGEWLDFLANTVGVFLGSLLSLLFL